MRNSLPFLLLGGCLAAWAQDTSQSKLKVSFPENSPVTVVSADWGDSRDEALGGAAVLDLHTSLLLRNASQQRIRGVTLLLLAQEVSPGGKASVAVPSLDIKPGETFPMRIDLRLLRPLLAGGGPLVRVELDGVLFDNLSFFGPNKLNSRRVMTAWELEARRDRRHFKSVLEARGVEGLKLEMQQVLAQQSERPSLDVQISRRGRTTAMLSPAASERQFAFLKFPGEPIEPISGSASVNGSEARSPRIEVINRSDRPIRYFEIGWIIRDRQGREFLAGSVPASNPDLRLAPGQKEQVLEDAALRFSRQAGQPVVIEKMTGFVSQVEFSDGSIWIPSRRSVLAPSPEEQRLSDLYRKKGPAALVNELNKF